MIYPRRVSISPLALLLLAGCSKNEGPVPPPELDRLKIAERAMATYDANHDGAIAGSEIDASPALKQSLRRLDKDRDGRITPDEIAARIDFWRERNVGTFAVNCRVTLDGKPLAGATVTFVPEEFLGPEIPQATGTTNAGGMARISPGERGKGVYIGWYRVKISKEENGKELVPAKYNVKTVLGQEVAPDNDSLRGTLKFDLKSG